MRLDRSAGGRSRQPRSQQASQDAEVACATMGFGQDSELEDDHRNVVPRRVDPSVPPDVVDALEQDLCEPAMVPADPDVEVGRQCNEDFQKSTEEIGDLTRVDSDEEPPPRSHSGIGCLQEACEVFHMESDVDDEMPLSHARSSALPPTSHDVPTTGVDPSSRTNRFSPLSAEIDDEPILPAVGTAPSRRRLTLVGVGRDNQSRQSPGDSELEIVESELADRMSVADEVSEGLEEPLLADPLPTPPFPRADVTRGRESR